MDDFSAKRFEGQNEQRLPAIRTARLPNGWVDNNGTHISADNYLIEEATLSYKDDRQNHPALRNLRPFKKFHRHRGPLISLSSKGAYNYYHWTLETLPRLAALQKLHPGATLYARTHMPFQRQMLEKVWRGQILAAQDHPLVVADELLVCSMPHPAGIGHPWAVQWLQGHVAARVEAKANTPQKFIINRNQAKVRRVTNSQELSRWGAAHGFAEVQLEDLGFDEQVNIFRNAKWIVAPHGAAQTNLAYCPPGTPVIEFLSDSQFRQGSTDEERYWIANTIPEVCYWALAGLAGLRYGCLECPTRANGIGHQTFDITVDIEKLDALYRRMA